GYSAWAIQDVDRIRNHPRDRRVARCTGPLHLHAIDTLIGRGVLQLRARGGVHAFPITKQRDCDIVWRIAAHLKRQWSFCDDVLPHRDVVTGARRGERKRHRSSERIDRREDPTVTNRIKHHTGVRLRLPCQRDVWQRDRKRSKDLLVAGYRQRDAVVVRITHTREWNSGVGISPRHRHDWTLRRE